MVFGAIRLAANRGTENGALNAFKKGQIRVLAIGHGFLSQNRENDWSRNSRVRYGSDTVTNSDALLY